MHSTLKEIVLQHSGFDAPITGGNGRNIEAAIVVHPDGVHSLQTVEMAVLWSLGAYKQLGWEVHDEERVEHSGRVYDEVQLIIRAMSKGKVHATHQSVYFDVTDCI